MQDEFQAITVELHEDQLNIISDIEGRIRNKIVEIRASDVLCEEDVNVWLENIKKEINSVKESSSIELNVAKDPVLMKEATTMIIKIMSPHRFAEVEASNLLAVMSKGLDLHYDCQAPKSH